MNIAYCTDNNNIDRSDLSCGKNTQLAIICFSAAAILLCFLVLTQLGVFLSFLFDLSPCAFIAPIAFILSLFIGVFLGKRAGLAKKLLFWPVIIVIAIITISILVSAVLYDMSWDGLWYHLTGIYKMAEGWNPVKQPMQSLQHHTQRWMRHYAKGSWYIALAFYKTSGSIELADCQNLLSFAATFLSVLAACLNFGMTRLKAVAVASIVSLNPVTTCQLYCTYVDGLLISYMACFLAAVFSSFLRINWMTVLIIAASVILCISVKFSGLVYICFACAGIGLYCLIKRRDMIFRYGILLTLAVIIGTAGLSYNPYVTNYRHRGHIFYPLMGTEEHPSLAMQGRDPIEMYETPHNMFDKNRFQRFGYAIFGRPGSQPFMGGKDAELMWPFCLTKKDFTMTYFHELRISGFGPFFSGIFLVGIALLITILFWPKLPKIAIIIAVITIVASLSISKHSWWARYGPQLWFLPVVPVAAIFYKCRSRVLGIATWALVALIMVNALIAAVVHVSWEIETTKTLRKQMAQLKEVGEIEIDFKYFDYPFSRRLDNAGVKFKPIRRNSLRDGQEIISVCPGYPGTIKYKIPQ